MSREGGRVRYSLRQLIITVGVTATLIGLVVLIQKRSKLETVETEVMGNLVQISRAFCAYSIKTGKLPPAANLDAKGNAMSSWRLRMLPLITSPGADYDLDVPWTAAANQPLASRPCWVYCIEGGLGKSSTDTNLFAITGSGTAFDPEKSVSISEVDRNVILVVEAVGSGVRWMEPSDYDVTELLKCKGKLRDCVHPIVENRVHLLFADGAVWSLSGDTPMERIKPFLTLKGAQRSSRETELGEFCLRKRDTAGIADLDRQIPDKEEEKK